MSSTVKGATPTVIDIVASIAHTIPIYVWGLAANKSLTLWNDVKKRTVILIACVFGMVSSLVIPIGLISKNQYGIAANNIRRECIGLYATFFLIYHLLSVYTKLVRLNLTKRLGTPKITNVLKYLNIGYVFVQVASCIGTSMIAWSPVYGSFTTDTTNLVAFRTGFTQAVSFITALDIILGVFVELATIFYCRAVFFNEAKSFSLKALGPIEYISVLGALFSILCIVLGPMLRVEFDLFLTLVPCSMLIYQSLVCLSIVNSVEEVKKSHTPTKGLSRVSAHAGSINSQPKAQNIPHSINLSN